MAKTKKMELVSVSDYATRCGVKRQAIYLRIDSGNINPVDINGKPLKRPNKARGEKWKGVLFIDLATTPILEAHAGRPTAQDLLEKNQTKTKK